MKKVFFGFVILLGMVTSACSNGGGDLTVDESIEAFANAGLEAESPTEMTKDDYGMAPMKAEEGKRILLPSLCEDCGGRVFSYDSQDDLEQMKAYYDEMGEESAMLFSWTIVHKNILVQLNGDLSEDQYKEYEKALKEL
ncbi:stress protein [Bacillus mesophilum]|uniref:Stress protein n=1 Tax=Bacillus mesophilum TaxID=1071718 RepID=A0A7V7RM36_9BACI|nr:stress protein [Bacillus mesophilum]KAB2332920.1 stress protein [Bacillus mesophilum]